MSQFPSEEATEKAKELLALLKGMTIYEVKGVLEIITRSVECSSNGSIFEPLPTRQEFFYKVECNFCGWKTKTTISDDCKFISFCPECGKELNPTKPLY